MLEESVYLTLYSSFFNFFLVIGILAQVFVEKETKLKRLRVLLIVEQCDPDGMSVPLLGYRFSEEIHKFADIALVTRAKYREQLKKTPVSEKTTFIEDSPLSKAYGSWLSRYTLQRSINWPLLHALKYPLYAEFNRRVYRRFAPLVHAGKFDLVHAITPMIPRYPVKLSLACDKIPFLLGPVNGGLPFPHGFDSVANQEYSRFNKLRLMTHMLPGYQKTYDHCQRILVGSRYTQEMLRDTVHVPPEKLLWFPENGIPENLVCPDHPRTNAKELKLLFVGRLVPYKGAHWILKAMARARHPAQLTLVGDGPERQALMDLAEKLKLKDRVDFVGWVPQAKTNDYYRKADVFCFPSIREFGGAVVLEAMAAGLPCIIVDNGGIGEYLTPEAGIKIEPKSEVELVDELVRAIDMLATDRQKRTALSAGAIQRAQDFTWENKGRQLEEIYASVSNKR